MNLLQVLIALVPIALLRECKFYAANGVYDTCKQKEGRQRGTWNGKKADNDFYKKIVGKVIELLRSCGLHEIMFNNVPSFRWMPMRQKIKN